MVKKIIKRDGNIVPFDSERIKSAIKKAAREEIDPVFIETITKEIENKEKHSLTVEEVQRIVEHYLMKSDYEDTARAYITYRKKRDVEREINSKNIKTFNELVEIEDTDIKNENANMNGNTPAGQMMKFASITTNNYAEGYLISNDFVKLHKKGFIHIHDKDYYPTKTTTCVHYDLEKLFKDGFDTGHGFLREPNSIRSAFALTAIAFQTNQNQQHGGQSIPALDYYLAPYVAKTFKKYFAKYFNRENFLLTLEQLEENGTTISISNERLKEMYPREYKLALEDTVEETEQGAEAFLANMNSMHSRGGNQTVFSSVNYGTDTSVEGRLVMLALLKATERGLGRGETAIFPIQIFKVKDDINFSLEDFNKAINNIDDAIAGKIKFKTTNFDIFLLSCIVSSKRLFPNFLFLDSSFNKNDKWKIDDPKRYIYELATMGCRTRVYDNLFGERTCIGRGNDSFSTINFVRLAILSTLEAEQIHKEKKAIEKEAIKIFFDKLKYMGDITAKQLYERYNFQCTAKAKQFPFLMGQGLWMEGESLKPNDRVEDVLKHGTLSIGFIGLAEALKMLIGKHHGESDEAQDLGLKIVGYLRELCDGYSKEYNLNYSCLATPAEGLSGRFTTIDRKEFGIIPGVTDRKYYTNSNHVPVYYPISAHDKISKEAPYHKLTNAGHILYVEMDTEAKKNIVAYLMLIKTMKDKDSGYVSINHPVDRCTECGLEAEIEDRCPKCNSDKIYRIRRITGYLTGTLDSWNSYKQAEEKDRVKHSI